ncbi:hypothetical protein FDP41_003544 [Naegleria fowleri]|uniref:Hemerythrin-like domain-containing protein n=1 Tax=Naegleria fowleri TaxID=5763 RepID=A0A6A5BS88_NAEFO|nr:uncharacterized protein FDP41_003544 [Naegleria fowleri]KAF0977552.1 hypothetical protein FDP41_003544 [Naegleria fowleri]CAG4718426.1 unnamed protein product [Naegleria fowleri]
MGGSASCMGNKQEGSDSTEKGNSKGGKAPTGNSDEEFLTGKVLIPWSDQEYKLGVGMVDEQHKVLVILINKLNHAINMGDMDLILEVFERLAMYTDFHFKEEEGLMDRCASYEASVKDNHKETHRKFISKVFSLKTKVEETHNSRFAMEALMFLSDWLITHICITDKKLCRFLKAENIDKAYDRNAAMDDIKNYEMQPPPQQAQEQ